MTFTGDSPTRSWLHADEIPDVDILGEEECWNLVARAPFGRLAIRTGDGIDIFPVNFVAREPMLYFRSAPGSKLVDIARAPAVAFEVDGERRRKHWSVVVHGTAERMSFDSEITASGVLDLDTMTSSAKWNYVRITATSITGRRLTKRWT